MRTPIYIFTCNCPPVREAREVSRGRLECNNCGSLIRVAVAPQRGAKGEAGSRGR
jgi:hypothetical protein